MTGSADDQYLAYAVALFADGRARLPADAGGRTCSAARRLMADDFDIGRIDDVIHGRVRLGIMAVLAGVDSADFNTLKARLQTTDGNLSVHLRKLEEAGFVAVEQTLRGPQAPDRRPR
jgi:DNA-binding transcriptional ArsR family regulator